AIMTTDTRVKIASAEASLAGRRVRVAGFAKGAGMIHPNMATMLAVLTTDARVEPARLDRALRAAVSRRFNRISEDGALSTIEPGRGRLWFGERDAVQLLERGLPVAFDAGRASALLAEDPAIVHFDLGLGSASAIVWTCDLSAEYVRVNADYTT